MLSAGMALLGGAVAEELDPTVQPVRASFYVFMFLAVALVLLLLSMLRHLRRARTNLPSSRRGAGGTGGGPSGGGPSGGGTGGGTGGGPDRGGPSGTGAGAGAPGATSRQAATPAQPQEGDRI
jgi:hypothetical protein